MPRPPRPHRTAKSLVSSVLVIVAALVAYLAKQRGWVGPPVESTQSSPAPVGGDSIATLVNEKRSNVVVEASGVVVKLLPDDNDGSRHQRFLVQVGSNRVLIAHNVDVAPRVPLREGDAIRFKGEFEYNDRGGVIHWTHHDPAKLRPGGWIEVAGKKYE